MSREATNFGALDRVIVPKVLLTATSKMRAKHLKAGHELLRHMSKMIEIHPQVKYRYAYQYTDKDQSFDASYEHQGGGATCAQSDNSRRGNHVEIMW
jgi:hypothetical protein